MAFSPSSSLSISMAGTGATQDAHSSVASLGNNALAPANNNGNGNVKLSHAQTELQACEAHLAFKEQELERIRVEAVFGGLQRRCKALVGCGWMWGEKGKEALRALEASSHNVHEEETRPSGIGEWIFLFNGNLYRRIFTWRNPFGSRT
jgi:hypothetical protein